jgi:hypothetical protein
VTRVALFVAGLAGAFLAALALGKSFDVEARTIADAEHGEGMAMVAPAGLAVEQDGYRLVQQRDVFVAGRPQPFAFHIVGPDGRTVRDFDVEHERRLHLIVAGRATAAFLHLHPQQRSDGSWTVPLALPERGSYRVFADFTTGGERRTLGVDIVGEGAGRVVERRIRPYDVELVRDGERLEFHVTSEGEPVEVEPYLGAGGHLVVLREGDLAYIHAHAERDELAFDVPFPGEGRYRLYLQFKVGGVVDTARFEVTA